MDTLNLGCGNKPMANAVNHDLVRHRAEVDVVHDLNVLPWPWADGSFDQVVARAVLEHLRITLLESVNECWRVLRPGGTLWMKLPHWQHDMGWIDPTHYWHFSLKTVDLFDPRTRYGKEYAFYQVRPWRIVKGPRLNRAGTSFVVTMVKE